MRCGTCFEFEKESQTTFSLLLLNKFGTDFFPLSEGFASELKKIFSLLKQNGRLEHEQQNLIATWKQQVRATFSCLSFVMKSKLMLVKFSFDNVLTLHKELRSAIGRALCSMSQLKELNFKRYTDEYLDVLQRFCLQDCNICPHVSCRGGKYLSPFRILLLRLGVQNQRTLLNENMKEGMMYKKTMKVFFL